MGWPYRFILSLSDEELERRRSILDSRGRYAQVSGLVLLGAFFLYGLTRANQFEQKRWKSWWDSPAVRGGSETRKQYAITLSWLLWLVSLSIWRTGDGESILLIQHEYNFADDSTRLHPPNKGCGTCRALSVALPGLTGSYFFHLYFQLGPAVNCLLPDLDSAASADGLPPPSWAVRYCASCMWACSSFPLVLCPGAPSCIRHSLCETYSGFRCSIRVSGGIFRYSDPVTWPCQCLEVTEYDQRLKTGISAAVVLYRAFCAGCNFLQPGLFSCAVCAAVCFGGYWGISGKFGML